MATRYKNLGGNHTQGDGSVVPTGGVFVDQDNELVTKFTGKFEVMERDVTVNDPQETEGTVPPKTSGDPVKPDTDRSEAEGEDVTGEYPAATAAGLKVVKAKKGWTVYDTEGTPINDEPVRKKDVDGLIAEWIED